MNGQIQIVCILLEPTYGFDLLTFRKVYNLLAQRDNKLNLMIAQATKRDSAAMKIIAVVTMVSLPSAYVAASLPTLFEAFDLPSMANILLKNIVQH